MKMRHCFTSKFAVVDDQTESFINAVDPEIRRDLLRGEEQVAQYGLILGPCFTYPWDWLLGDDKNVGWCLRRDVLECQRPVVLENDVGRDIAGNDFLEKGHG